MQNKFFPKNVEDLSWITINQINRKKLSGIVILGFYDISGCGMKYFLNGEEIQCSSPIEFSKLLKLKAFL